MTIRKLAAMLSLCLGFAAAPEVAFSQAQPSNADLSRPSIIAHRGSSRTAPENTLASVNLAWEQDADAVEVDVYMTKDERIVCLHDDTTERTTNKDFPIERVAWETVKDLDAGSWKSPEYAGEPIPLLSSVIASIPEGKKLYIEIKAREEIVPRLTEVIEASGKQDRVIIICFDFDTLAAAHAAMPEIPTMLLLSAPKNKDTGKRGPIDPANAVKAKAAGFDALDVSYLGVHPPLVEACRREELGLYIWTLDDPAKAEELFKAGVAGITTNVPDVMLEHFTRRPAPLNEAQNAE